MTLPNDSVLYYVFAGLGVAGGFLLPRLSYKLSYKLLESAMDLKQVLPGLLNIIQVGCVYLTFLALIRAVRIWAHHRTNHQVPLELTNALNAGSDLVLYMLIFLILAEYWRLEWATKSAGFLSHLRSRFLTG